MKTITTLLLCAATLLVNAQTKLTSDKTVGEELNFAILHAKYPWVFSRYSTSTPQKKSQYTGWYSFVDDARDVGVTWTNITNTSLFPDSTVYQLYGSDNNGTELGFTGLHNIGQVFDPKYEFFPAGERLSRFNKYTIDSIAFFYRYSYNKPGSVDTLRIQFYHNAQIRNVMFSTPDSSVSLQYDPSVNKSTGANFAYEIELYLDEDDTTGDESSDAKLLSFAVPGGGLKPTPNGEYGRNNIGLAAFTMSYHPGYEYSFGDTLQHDWANPPVVNKLNHFRPTRVSDRSQTLNESQNRGMFIFRDNLYDNANSGWANLFVPGNAFQDSEDQLYAQFHVISDETVGINTTHNGYSLGSIYPNPASSNNKLNIEFTLGNTEQVTIELYSITGAKMTTLVDHELFNEGTHTVSSLLENIPSGIYLYTIKAGNYTATNRVNIIN